MPAHWRSGWTMPAGSGERGPGDYERGRPGWPSAVVEGLDAPSGAVLDLGAGTGEVTRPLAQTFGRGIAIEPGEAMRRILVERCPGVQILSGTAEAIPIADTTVDLVFVAQAFHTFDGRRAVPEIARVLRPCGSVVVLWNLPAGPWQPSTTAAEAV